MNGERGAPSRPDSVTQPGPAERQKAEKGIVMGFEMIMNVALIFALVTSLVFLKKTWN
ncbi:MAG: hypothetical protein H6683_04615 [Deltaproteobacteria bacterium]|nr:hypothetical protein [Deltaproteobacteria bacterium]MCB9478942.1 hypothetical protein [Deltaproteobacteria bacterium]